MVATNMLIVLTCTCTWLHCILYRPQVPHCAQPTRLRGTGDAYKLAYTFVVVWREARAVEFRQWQTHGLHPPLCHDVTCIRPNSACLNGLRILQICSSSDSYTLGIARDGAS